MLLLGNILRRNAASQAFRDKTALIFGDRRTTYAALNEQANRLANALVGLGVRKGDRVAVLGRNSDFYVAIYFALAKSGAIAVPVNFWYRTEEIRYTLSQSEASLFLVERRFAEVAGSAMDQVRIFGYDEGGGASDLARLMAGTDPSEPAVEVAEDDPHIILYTSGTTGFPKGATLTHKNHYLHAMSLALSTGNATEDVGAVIYPLFHTGGPDCLVLPHFLVGATLVVLDGGDPKIILEATERHRITNLFCVPTVWRRILRTLEETPFDVSSVRRCLGSSDTFPPDLLDRILSRFSADVYVTYGLTEAGCILTVCRLTREDRTKIGAVGRPMPTVEVRVVDPAGRDVPIGEVGEVVARGPAIMAGYWNMPEKTAEAMRGGWLHSGDLARWDADGYLSIAGRAKDVIISGGENIYPAEIERALKELAGVRDAAVVGVPDREWGESVLAVIVPEEGAALSPEDVIAFVRGRLAGFKKPRYVTFVDALPVTAATGKVQKGALREQFKKRYGTV
ncbi:MAG: long-chain-fatty-acid--CoA ligase [Candidatus Latescibacteria bacterium]|nr:long-chain-fatty-acid--CoA ligase [Candidatus Latescibacterota bacterium]